jgi:hypothetical protein
VTIRVQPTVIGARVGTTPCGFLGRSTVLAHARRSRSRRRPVAFGSSGSWEVR